jgi:hypothetical protein
MNHYGVDFIFEERIPLKQFGLCKSNESVSCMSVKYSHNSVFDIQRMPEVLNLQINSNIYLLKLFLNINKLVKKIKINTSGSSCGYHNTCNCHNSPGYQNIFNFLSIMSCIIENVYIEIHLKIIKYLPNSVLSIQCEYTHQTPNVWYLNNLPNKLTKLNIHHTYRRDKDIILNKLPSKLDKIIMIDGCKRRAINNNRKKILKDILNSLK